MRAYTLLKGPILSPGIRVIPSCDSKESATHCIPLGRDAKNSIFLCSPLPEGTHIYTSSKNPSYQSFHRLDNNIASFIVHIRDQSPIKGGYEANFDHSLKPIAAGYCGQGEGAKLGGGFEYLVPLIDGDSIRFSLIGKLKGRSPVFTLICMKNELVIQLETPHINYQSLVDDEQHTERMLA